MAVMYHVAVTLGGISSGRLFRQHFQRLAYARTAYTVGHGKIFDAVSLTLEHTHIPRCPKILMVSHCSNSIVSIMCVVSGGA